jgi:hypothetical protein
MRLSVQLQAQAILTPEKDFWCPFFKRLCGPQKISRNFEEEKNYLFYPTAGFPAPDLSTRN